MTCYHPLSAWMSKECNSRTGKSVVVFSPPSDILNYRSIQVPCGQCIGCKLDYSKQWAMRCYHEARMFDKSIFVTLTYDDDNVPWSNITGEQTLRKKDLQNFWKELRRHPDFKNTKIRYFACGEYGDKTNRPHYHAIIFNCDFDDKQIYKLVGDGNLLYISDKLSKIWHKGQCAIANVSFDTCAYVARYVVKKLNGSLGVEKYEGIEKEFCCMSRRPGIGYEWFKKYYKDVYPYDEVLIRDSGRLRHLKPCRYYDNLYDISSPADLVRIKERRIRLSERHAEENSKVGRMDQRELFKLEQIKNLKRSVD